MPVIRCRIDKADVIWNRFRLGPDAARVDVTRVSLARDLLFVRADVGMAFVPLARARRTVRT